MSDEEAVRATCEDCEWKSPPDHRPMLRLDWRITHIAIHHGDVFSDRVSGEELKQWSRDKEFGLAWEKDEDGGPKLREHWPTDLKPPQEEEPEDKGPKDLHLKWKGE